MKRLSPLLFLSTLALAQVGLLDGPRPSTEVRGTLQGNAREGYRVVEFLVESGANPVQGSMNQSLSPADRDVVAKSVLSSLGDLRAFYARQPQGSTLWFFVPEVSAWTQTLAQEFRARNGGQERFVVPEGTARSYCSLYRNDSRYHVMPRESLAKEQSFAVIYPPSGNTQKGAVMAGRFLVDRPDWQEPDYLSFTTRLLPTQDGLPEADALVWGYLSRANLKARVRFKDWTLSSWANIYFSFYRDASWNGTFSRDAGRGEESFYLDGFLDGSSPYTVRDTAGRDRGTAQVVANKELVGYELDQNAGASFDTGVWANEINGLRFGVWVKGKYEYFTAYDCSWTKRVGLTDIYACKYKDDQGRYRGSGAIGAWWQYRGSGAIGAWWQYRHVTGTVYPLVPQYEVKGYSVYVSLKGWQQTWRYASDNDRPVEAFGYVTAEGKRYRVPGLLQPTGKGLEVAEGDPYVSYITRSISPQGNPLAGTGREEAKVWFKPLRDWCAERGL